MGTTVEDAGDRFKALLASSVPDLNFDDLAINSEIVRAKFDSNSDLMFCLEFVVHHALHETRFSNTSVANNNQLKQMVVLCQCLVLDNLVRHVFKLVDLVLLHLF
jgi:hypothetical protein